MSADHLATNPGGSSPSEGRLSAGSLWTWLALLLALLASVGSLALSLVLGLRACPLCFYQRSFVLGVAALLAVGLLVRGTRPGVLSLLALPLAGAGAGIAAFHVSLESRGVLECPLGLFGLGTAPQQSLGVLALLTLVLVIDVLQQLKAYFALIGALVLGGVMAWGCLATTPPSPRPTAPYPVELNKDGCRIPYVPGG